MTLEDNFCTWERSKKLTDLGISPRPDRSLGYWTLDHGRWYFTSSYLHSDYPAFNVTEMGVMIGRGTKMAEDFHNAVSAKINGGNSITICFDPNFVADFVIDYLQTGCCHVEPINERLQK